MPDPAAPRHRRILTAALGLLTLAVYWRVRRHGFILLDDADYVRLNPWVNQGLTWAGVKWAFTTGHASNWHPLTWLSHMLDVTLFGPNPGAFHIVNVVVHALNAVLLFRLFERLTGALWPSAFVGALFAWHPLHVESVAWIAERKDVLSTLFLLLTLRAYAGWVTKRTVARYLAVFTLLALGLMAKPMLVTTPFVLLLLDAWPLRRVRAMRDWPRLIVEKLPLFALAAASSIATVVAQQGGKAVASIAVFPIPVRLANALVATAEYLAKTLWPAKLAVFYPHPGLRPWWQIAMAMIALAAITGLAVRLARVRPFLLVGWLWFLGTLVPVIGLVQVGDQALADRYTYVPLIGVSVMLAWGGATIIERRRDLAAPLLALGAALPVAWLALTAMQLRHWRNDETLFTHARAVTRNNYVANSIVGSMLLSRGQVQEARQCYADALRVRPSYPKALSGMGDVLAAQGRPAEAMEFYEAALRVAPNLSDTHNAWGGALVALEQWDEALRHFTEAVRLEPGFAEAEFNRAAALRKLGRLDEAASAFARARQWQPRNGPALLGLADCLIALKRDREALGLLQPILQADPNAVEMLHRIAWILSTSPEPALRNGAEAVVLAARACDLTSQRDAASLVALAAAYAEMGRFDDAMRVSHKAVELAEKSNDTELREVLRKAQAAFQTRTAYRRS